MKSHLTTNTSLRNQSVKVYFQSVNTYAYSSKSLTSKSIIKSFATMGWRSSFAGLKTLQFPVE